jgi:uncharacterized oxidoreductase
MKLTENTILITGGGSGIGRGLAEAFHAMGNRVIIAGRRRELLEKTAAANPGMEFRVLDQADAGEIRSFAAQLIDDFPGLNVLVNNAGIQHVEDLASGVVDEAEATITTNLLGPIRLTGALLPALMTKPHPAILNVTSGLAFIPFAMIPTYCATKAALRSYTQSLRYQLRDTAVQVIEIIPPWVQTELQGERGMNPKAMPLDEYIAETMSILKKSPDASEIVVERVKPLLRFTERGGGYDEFFAKFNEQSAMHAKEVRS